MAWQEALIEAIHRNFDGDERVTGRFVGGSFGKGEADAYSDVDFVALIASGHEADFGDVWRTALEKIQPLVFWGALDQRGSVFNAITDEWQRTDLVITSETLFRKRGKGSVRPLIDRLGLYEALPDTVSWSGPNRGVVAHIIREFIRVLGLLPVAVGREEYLTGIAGAGLLRNLIFSLLTEQVQREDKGGMLAWSRRLSPEQLAVLASLPPVEASRESLINAHLAYAEAFLPRAREFAAQWAVEWPEAFEDATWRHLENSLGVVKPAAI